MVASRPILKATSITASPICRSPRFVSSTRFGNATQEFVFTGVDAYPEASATRKAIERQEARPEPPSFHPILTAFGVDPVDGDVWMGLHNTLVHFDKDGIRRSEYQIYTPKGSPVDATVDFGRSRTSFDRF